MIRVFQTMEYKTIGISYVGLYLLTNSLLINDKAIDTTIFYWMASCNNVWRDILGERAVAEGLIYRLFADQPDRFVVSELPRVHHAVIGVDFGGGTFDAALMRIEDGIMKSVDTAGNNKLGGKDIDKAIEYMKLYKKNGIID